MNIIRRKHRDRSEISDEITKRRILNRQVYMANERTFLAWIRTGIGVMAFGFVVVKFALFLRQMSLVLFSQSIAQPALPSTHLLSAVIGIVLVALGAIMSLLGFIRYKKVELQIDKETYRPMSIIDILLTLSVLAVGIFLVIYLINSLK